MEFLSGWPQGLDLVPHEELNERVLGARLVVRAPGRLRRTRT
ncbi:hypothetical protein ACQEU8_33400 [Streptomyces sp. CA-250714]